MTYVGAAYILWLSWKIYKSKPHDEGEDSGRENNFVSGFLLQFVNPKVIIYGITIFATFILPYYESSISIGLFAVGLAFIGFVSVNCLALFGSGFNVFLKRYYKIVNSIMALLLVYCAVSLFH
jgi:threonine/homoserine/homoserine lactone efflux protein